MNDDFEVFYKLGENHFLNLLKEPEQCRSTINGLSNMILFNENDHYTSSNGVIHFYLSDKKHTLGVLVNLLKNTYSLWYYFTDDDDFDNELFSVRRVPFDMSPEWYFQLSTTRHIPFSYEFHLRLVEYVEYLENIMQPNHCIDILREHCDITPYPSR